MFITNSEDRLALLNTIFASHISSLHLYYVNWILWLYVLYDKMHGILFVYSWVPNERRV